MGDGRSVKRDTRNRKRKGLENQLQPAKRTQRKKDDRLVDELLEVTTQSQVLDMVRNGRSLVASAQLLSISPTEVRKAVSTALAAHQESVSDHAEYVYNVNYLRLESLYSNAMNAAFDESSYSDKKKEDDVLGDRERQWAQFALNVLKEQNKMAETQLRYLGPSSSKDKDKGKGKTEIYAPTIVAGGDLFRLAQGHLSDSFMEAHGHRLGPKDEGDLNAEDVLLMELNPPESSTVDPVPAAPSEDVLSDKVRDIEKNFERLEEKLIGTVNDDQQ